MKTLKFTIRDKHITRQDGNAVVAGAVNHYELECAFDEDWNGLTKTVVLENGDVKVELLYTGGLTLPWEVCREGGLLLSVRGTKTLGDGRTQVVRTARMAKPIPVEPGGSEEGRATMLSRGTCTGPNVMYFETGQGSELSSEAHNGWDQVTMEARCYGFGRHYKPFLVNTVVGFIGPEYLYNPQQIIRAALEDHFMGKLHGLPMGCDCCYTNHADTDQNSNENLMLLLAVAGVNFIISLPMGDDIMLNYQTNSFHDIATARQLLNLRPAPEFEQWLERHGIMENGMLTARAGDASFLF